MARFNAQVSSFTQKSKRAMTLIMQTAFTDLAESVEEDTPVDTGNAARSWLASTTAMPAIRPNTVEFDSVAATQVAIMGIEAGKPVYLGAQAEYMPRLNYGFTGTDRLGRTYNQQGLHFVERNAEQWPTFVKRAEALHRVK